jgi:hypothetical protein
MPATESEQRQAEIIEQTMTSIRTAGPWPPSLEHLAPPYVLEASNEATEVQERLVAAQAALAAATGAVDAAVSADRTAALQAAEAGKPAPKATAPKAREAVAVAERDVSALTTLASQKVDLYLKAVVANHSQLVEAAQAEQVRVAGELAAAIEAIAGRWTSIADLDLLLTELGDDPRWLQGRQVSFVPARAGKLLHRDPLTPAVRDLLIALREQLGEQQSFARETW